MYIAISNSITSSSQMNGAAASGGGGSFDNTYSMAFDGIDDYIEAPLVNLGGYGVGEEVTVSFWIKRGATANTEMILSNTGVSGGAFIEFVGTTSMKFTSYNNAVFNSVATQTALARTDWMNVLFTLDSSNVCTLYIDGVLTEVGTGSPNSNCAIDRIGMGQVSAYPTLLNKPFTGNLDEISGFKSKLGASDIAKISASPIDLSTDLSVTPEVWWRMGDNGSWKSPQWLLPQETNKDKYSNFSFSFDGVDDYIEIPNITPRFGTQNPATADSAVNASWSINLWAYIPSGLSGTTPLYNTPLGFATYTWTLTWLSTKLQFGARYSSLRVYETGTTAVNTDQWNNITVTFDGVDANTLSSWKLYINGVDITALSSGGHLGTNTSGKTYIGRGLTAYAEVKMDEVSVYDVELTASNVTSLYNSGTPTTLPVTPLAHWKMGEDATFSTNWTVPDAVGSSAGTSANMTIEDRVGDAPNSTSNSLSYNMTESDRETDVPS